jgi:membrane AbrB-like protein
LVKVLGTDVAAIAVTLALGAVGGGVAAWAQLPLGFLMGSLVVTAVAAMAGWRPLGRDITLPAKLRMGFVPVIGVAIGGAFTPQVAGQMAGWVPSLLALCLYVPLAHGLGYAIYRRGGIGRREALFGAVPGGLIESVMLAEQAGADVREVTVLQFLRLILAILSVPMIFWAMTGQAVGSAAGVRLAGQDAALGVFDVLALVGAGVFGALGAKLLRLPGWIVMGPLVASAALHGFGWVTAGPPGWMVSATQVVLGTGLGARFAGVRREVLLRAGKVALANGAAALLLALAFAEALHWAVGEPVAAVFLAFAPGGLAEMSLIALSLQISVIYVTAHHALRIVLAVAMAQLAGRWAK